MVSLQEEAEREKAILRAKYTLLVATGIPRMVARKRRQWGLSKLERYHGITREMVERETERELRELGIDPGEKWERSN